MKVASIQFCPVFKQTKGNLTTLGKLVLEAGRNGAKLIVMPELATTGYSFMDALEAEPFAEDITKVKSGAEADAHAGTMGFMWQLAKRTNATLVWGMIEKDVGSGKLYNSQVYLEPDGYFESYRKVNQWGNDFLWCEPGKSNPPVIQTKIDGKPYKIGLLICRDVRDKKDAKWKSFYDKGDADIVCFSANWGDGGFPSVSWMEFARDNDVHLIVSNRYGKETCNNFGEGGICVIEPGGKVHCKGVLWNADCIVYAEINK